jgi:non-canonical purine NTP pyrophosphatase (RdgB/HAM1 family)
MAVAIGSRQSKGHNGRLRRLPLRPARPAVSAFEPPVSPVLVIASGNAHKVAEISAMLDAVGLEVRRQPEGLEIEETGRTYLENARLKAETVAQLTGQWALADDSGLEVDALGGAPGLYSARYAPTDHERIHRLLHELGGTPYRSASFNSAMALADPSGRTVLEAQGICRGQILTAPVGHGGGYDPIFWVREAGLTYAQMGQHLKDKLGSRGKAARALAPELRRLLGLGR